MNEMKISKSLEWQAQIDCVIQKVKHLAGELKPAVRTTEVAAVVRDLEALKTSLDSEDQVVEPPSLSTLTQQLHGTNPQ